MSSTKYILHFIIPYTICYLLVLAEDLISTPWCSSAQISSYLLDLIYLASSLLVSFTPSILYNSINTICEWDNDCLSVGGRGREQGRERRSKPEGNWGGIRVPGMVNISLQPCASLTYTLLLYFYHSDTTMELFISFSICVCVCVCHWLFSQYRGANVELWVESSTLPLTYVPNPFCVCV